MIEYLAGLAVTLLLLFLVIDLTFSRSIIYKVETHRTLKSIKVKIDAVADLRQRYEQETWWEGDEGEIMEDQRYLTWLLKAYAWAKKPWWQRLFIEPPEF